MSHFTPIRIYSPFLKFLQFILHSPFSYFTPFISFIFLSAAFFLSLFSFSFLPHHCPCSSSPFIESSFLPICLPLSTFFSSYLFVFWISLLQLLPPLHLTNNCLTFHDPQTSTDLTPVLPLTLRPVCYHGALATPLGVLAKETGERERQKERKGRRMNEGRRGGGKVGR